MQVTPANPTRYTYLDLLRGFAAFAVLIVHYRWFYAMRPMDWNSSFGHTLPLASFLHPFYDRGGLAVQLFWVLSGVIFTIKYDLGGRLDIKKFWVWRFARLYPLHFFTLVLIATLQGLSIAYSGVATVYPNNDPYHFVLQLFFASNWGFERGPSFNAPIWSISVEIIAYAVFCLYVIYFRKFPILKLLIVLAAGGAWIIFGNLIMMCISLFFLGGVVAQAYHYARSGMLPRYTRSALVLGAAVLLSGSIAAIAVGVRIPDKAFFYVLFPAILLLVLELDHRAPAVPRQFEWFGAITYSTYLMHMPILITFKLWIDTQPNRLAILGSPTMLVTYLGVVTCISIMVYRYIEMPAQRCIQRWYLARVGAATTRANVPQNV